MKEQFAQMIAGFRSASSNIEMFDPESEVYQEGKAIEESFTSGVECLRSVFPSDRIRDLGQAIWDVFHHRKVELTLGPQVASLSFALYRSNPQGIVFVPHN